MMQYLKPFAAVITFVIGTFAAYLLLPLVPPVARPGHDCRVDKSGHPLDPHAVCDIYRPDDGVADAPGLPETVTVCDLASRPERYDGKLVRLRADLETTKSHRAYSVADKACVGKGARVSCAAGNTSCSDLFEALRESDVNSVEFRAEGRFFASVLERPPGGISSRVMLFEITGRIHSRGPGKKSEKPSGRGMGTGSGTGYGSGSGTGVGTGSGSGQGSGSGDYR
jgi:hypothetical protein